MTKIVEKPALTAFVLCLTVFSLLFSTNVSSQNYISEEVSNWETTDCYDICLQDDYAFVSSINGLLVIDISNPEEPVMVSQIELTNGSYGVDVENNFAYIAADYGGLVIADVSNPIDPYIVSQYQIEGDIALKVMVCGSFVYVNFLVSGVHILDISNPLNPIHVVNYSRGYGRDMKIQDDILFFCTPRDGLRIIDISNKRYPSLICLAPDSIEAYDAFISDDLYT